ncbi:MAG: SusC/RagA family TonB-linked outer membrane protein [Bacteroidetes bacterium]|nr:SusC/RagA family TonB-linked outer membrane protein [Bacteroidota bacterium]
MKRLLVIFMGSILIGSVSAQSTRQVTGKVTGNDNAPVASATVQVKGGAQSAMTGNDGSFSITTPAGATVLTITSAGFLSADVEVPTGQSTVNVTLNADNKQLNEVVVTAMGLSKSKRTLSYATQQVQTNTFSKARELNVANSLIGRVAGLDVARSSSGVGGSSRVVLRGDRSITGNNQALIVIDGVPMDNSNFSPGNANGGRDGGDGISSINPDDIESINVLRGASATALYGARAANGALIINTKKGTRKGLGVSVNSSYIAEQAIVLQEFQDVYGQGSAGVYNRASEFSWGPKMDGSQVAMWGPKPSNVGQTYSFKPQPGTYENFYSTGNQASNSLAVSGGGDRMQAYFSYTNVNAKGIVDNNTMKRNTMNLRISGDLGSKVSYDSKVTYLDEVINNRQQTGEAFANLQRHILRLPRNISLQAAEDYDFINPASGQLRQNYWNPGSNGGQNPYWIKNRVSALDKRARVTAFGSMTYKPLEWLSFMGRAGIDQYNDDFEGKWYNNTYTIADNGDYQTLFRKVREINLDFFGFVKKSFGDFNVDATFGASRQTFSSLAQSTSTGGLNRDNLFIPSNARSPQIGRSLAETEKQGVFMTADFSFRDFLTLTASARNDWSSTLPKESRSYFFPSAGFSAILSNILDLPTFISFAKLRGNYAVTGNDARPYLLNQTYTFSAGGPTGFISRDGVRPFPDLKPELTTSLEVGTEVRLLNNRFGFDLGWYTSESKNQLFSVAIPPASGWSSQFINAGLVRNTGVELTMNGAIVRNSALRWDVDLNFARNTNLLVELTPDLKRLVLAGDFVNDVVVEEGKPLGQLYSRGYQRNAQGQILVDATGLPRISAGKTVFMGNSRPDWTGGINNRISWKSFSLSFLISARMGGYVSSFTNAVIYADGVTKKTLEGRDSYVVDGVRDDGSKNTTATNAEKFWVRVGGRNTPAGEVFTYDASNIRLRELVLSYNLPNNVIKGLPFQSGSISLVGRNLFFLLNRAEGFDPELTAGAQNTTVGLESFSLPSTRTVGVNLNLSF